MNVVVINLCRPPCSFWTNELVSVCWDAFLKPYLYERCHTTHATYCTSLHIDIHINSCLLVMHVHIITYLKRVFDHCSHTQNTHKYTLHIDAQVVILSIFKDGNLKSVISDCWPVHCQALIVCLLPQEPRPVEGGWESTLLAHGKVSEGPCVFYRCAFSISDRGRNPVLSTKLIFESSVYAQNPIMTKWKQTFRDVWIFTQVKLILKVINMIINQPW